MKKIRVYIIISTIPLIFFMLILFSLMGGSSAAPIDPPATEEQAYRYQYIGSELGVPWDIILLTDAVSASQRGEDSIENYNPLLTSLEFCIIQETKYKAIEKETTVNGVTTKKKKWVETGTNYYTGKNKILDYLGYQDNLNYTDVSSLITDMNNTASGKSNSSHKYKAVMTVNEDFEEVLKNYIHLDEENITNVLELYNSKYLMYLYGYDTGTDNFNVDLPDLVIGNVTRNELVQVAASLLNYPYLFGGKSPAKGKPAGALDCSGFIDWVYIQCFGQGVSGGSLPSGVNVSGTAMQFYACQEITKADLKIGDLGFYYDPATMAPGKINHVGIYIGKINGQDAFIHCGGKYFGYNDRPNGRVGISINVSGAFNSYNPVTGGTFSPAIPGTNFQYFRRPNFQFTGDVEEGGEE